MTRILPMVEAVEDEHGYPERHLNGLVGTTTHSREDTARKAAAKDPDVVVILRWRTATNGLRYQLQIPEVVGVDRSRAKRGLPPMDAELRRQIEELGKPDRDPPSRRRTSDHPRPRSAEGNESLAYLLDRDVRAIGPEHAAAPPAPDIRLLISPSGSYRYVGLENGRPVSALQIMSYDGGVRGVIENVYTTPFARRRGWAARLLEVARKRFREVKHSDDLSPAGAAWKGTVRDAARDKDYRGQPVPFDFARAVYEVRRNRRGALEVLLDGIEEWFPRQYADAVADAEHHWAETGMPWVVLFNARVARARFRPWQDARSMMRTPFDIHTAASIARNGMPPYSAIIWPRRRSFAPLPPLAGQR